MVPLFTISPSYLSTGIGSPEIMDSSIEVFPSVIEPSTGILSPGLTLSISPKAISSILICSSTPFFTLIASLGANFSNSLTAEFVLLCAFASSI